MGKSAIIVGAGPGGLATSLLLRQAGVDVTIFERLPRPGGRTSSLEVDGFRFDLGPTFFLYPRVLAEILAAVGRDIETELPMVRLDPQYRVSFGSGGFLNATPDVARMKSEIARLSPADAASFPRFLAENRRKLESFQPVLERPFRSLRDLFDPRLLSALGRIRPWQSLERDLRRFFSDPRVRLAFSFQSKYLGMSPFRCPSLFSILSFLEYEFGVYHPIGGCSRVMERLAEIATEMGVRIHLGEPVEEILFRGRRAVGVRTARGRLAADALVVNADFAHAMRHLVPDRLRRRWSDRRLAKKRFSCSTFMLYLGIEGRLDHLPHHTIHIAREYERNLKDIEERHVLSDDPSFYVQNACVTDPSLARPGTSTLYVLAPVSHRHENIDWKRDARTFRATLLRSLEQVGIEDIERRILTERCVTPLDWESRYAVHLGATFNLSHNLSQMLHLRPRNRFEDLDGVYLVGGGTHPGSGLPVIFESARISSKLVLEDLGLERLGEQPKTPAVAHHALRKQLAHAEAQPLASAG